MADIRSLLRNERQARRVTHPHLTYSTTGQLICMICHIQLKTESLWNKHLRSEQHAVRLQGIKEAGADRPPRALVPDQEQEEVDSVGADDPEILNYHAIEQTTDQTKPHTNGSKKRKADSEDEEDDSRIKKSRVSDISAESNTQVLQEDSLPPVIIPPTIGDNQPQVTINEDEYAAFERDIATPPPPSNALDALTASANIIAAPLSAAELAAQAREEAEMTGKERREADMEAEREDAARQMEEELDEMADLEERVRRLREKREAIRQGRVERGSIEVGAEEMIDKGLVGDDGQGEDDDDEEDIFDEWDTWAR